MQSSLGRCVTVSLCFLSVVDVSTFSAEELQHGRRGAISARRSATQLTLDASRTEQKAKKDKQANEETFSFLIDPKDVRRSLARSPSSPPLYLDPSCSRSYLRAQADGNRPGEPGYDPRTLYIPKSAWTTFSPFERQFWEIKQNHYDTVLFFQKGKFFELYEEDAVRRPSSRS